jgi:hypothetical protein
MILGKVKVITLVYKVWVTQRDWTLEMKLVARFDYKVLTRTLGVMMVSSADGLQSENKIYD